MSFLRPAGRACLLVGLVGLFASPAQAVRIVMWNTLNYPGITTPADRNAAYRTVLNEIDPDMIIALEISDSTTAGWFFFNVVGLLDEGGWQLAPFVDVGDTSPACYYKPDVFDQIGSAVEIFGGDPRNAVRWEFRPDGYQSGTASFFPIAVHLKASSTQNDANRRTSTAEAIRNNSNVFFTPTSRFFYCGDFNFQNSGHAGFAIPELGYQRFVESQADNDGRTVDVLNPLNVAQNWHNSFSHADKHTQSPRTTSFGGGAAGGMDDRFDFFLLSNELLSGEGLSYIVGSYDEFGNDGLHFNQAINSTIPVPNQVVSQAVADAIHDASDHLPVVIDLRLPAKIDADMTLDFGTVTLGAVAELDLNVTNVAPVPAGDLDYDLSAPAGFSAPAGPFTETDAPGGNTHTISMDTATQGMKMGTLVIDSNDLDTPALMVTLTGEVIGTNPLGDLNRNGTVDMPDVPLFVTLVLDPDAADPEDQALADMNGDSDNDGDDVQLFTDALVN